MTAIKRIANIISSRDELSLSEAEEFIEDTFQDCVDAFERSEDWEGLWMDETGLEIDYLIDIIVGGE